MSGEFPKPSPLRLDISRNSDGESVDARCLAEGCGVRSTHYTQATWHGKAGGAWSCAEHMMEAANKALEIVGAPMRVVGAG